MNTQTFNKVILNNPEFLRQVHQATKKAWWDPDTQEELFQATLARAWIRRSKIRYHSFAEAINYFKMIVHSLFITHQRRYTRVRRILNSQSYQDHHNAQQKLKRKPPYKDIPLDIEAALEDPSQIMDQLDENLANVLMVLKKKERDALILTSVYDFTDADLMEYYGMSKGAIKSLKHRARTNIKQCLQHQGGI